MPFFVVCAHTKVDISQKYSEIRKKNPKTVCAHRKS